MLFKRPRVAGLASALRSSAVWIVFGAHVSTTEQTPRERNAGGASRETVAPYDTLAAIITHRGVSSQGAEGQIVIFKSEPEPWAKNICRKSPARRPST
jgi:hypothetical protein